jgi:uncharacterized protein YacL (UPF0231 family)
MGTRQISHHRELARIRRNWRDATDGERGARLKQAEADLESLRQQFRYVLEIGHELVLVLEKQGKIQQAGELAAQLEKEFTVLDDETLCRFGKLHKRAAIDAEAAGVVGAALEEFGIAETFYGKAYELSQAFYPRINQLSLRFARAGLLKQLSDSADSARRAEGQQLAETVQQDAIDMLNEVAIWHRVNADDDIWAPASQAEAKFLARQWKESDSAYRGVLKTLANRTTYIDIIRRQLELLVRSARRAEMSMDGLFADLDALFNPNKTV